MPGEPTGLEPVTPVRVTSTSATERGSFRKCRRQWFLTVVHRLDPQEGNVNFFLGKIYHAALEAYYRAQMAGEERDDAEIAALDAFQDRFDTDMKEVREQLGFAAAYAEGPFRESAELGMEMLQNYLERERTDPLLDEVLAVERRVNVPIRKPGGKRKVGELSVQTDVSGVKDGERVVADHKTASVAASSAHLDIDDQLTAEVYSEWKATGEFPERAIYNVSYKKAPRPPRELKPDKNGPRLSRDKSQLTTSAMYRAELARLGLSVADYADIVGYLEVREQSGEDPLFRREATFRTPGQMAAFEADLYEEFRDMRDVAAYPERAYPNPTSMNCSRCSVRTVCTTIQDGGDFETIIRSGFVVADPRR